MLAVYPGSFDPITFGHLDIIQRAASVIEKLIVLVVVNSAKKPLFSADDRIRHIKTAVSHLKNVSVASYSGLTSQFAANVNADVIIRGVRSIKDFESEMQIAYVYRTLARDIQTFFIPTDEKYAHLNSAVVKELAMYGQDFSGMVPGFLIDEITDKITKN